MKNLIAISGSLRKDSHNTNLLRNIIEINKNLNNDIKIELIDISVFPLFNQDLENTYPTQIQTIKDKIKNSNGVIFATPEYNRSISGVLKNMIDWTSRPYGTNPYEEKPIMILGASGGQIGTAVAQSHLKEVLLFLNAKIMGQPEIYISFASDKFDKEGKIIDEKTMSLVSNAYQKFLEFLN